MASKKRAKPVDLNTQILVQIRDELRTTRTELVAAIGRTNNRVGDLMARVVATEMRLGTQHVEILAALEKLQASVADALSRDAAINDLDERVSVLEQKAGVSQ